MMKIKPISYMSFQIIFDKVSIITDPQSVGLAGKNFPKSEADIVLFSDESLLGKTNLLDSAGLGERISPNNRETVFEIGNFGEYEIGEIMFRRPTNRNYYIIDDTNIRIVYMGFVGVDFTPDLVKNMGDVDVLIAPIGDGGIFPNFQKMQKIISNIDPTYLIPCGYKEDGMDSEQFSTLHGAMDFIKDAGYTNVKEDKELKLTSGSTDDNKVMEILILK